MVRFAEKRKKRCASCWSLLVMNGGGARRDRVFAATVSTAKLAPRRVFISLSDIRTQHLANFFDYVSRAKGSKSKIRLHGARTINRYTCGCSFNS